MPDDDRNLSPAPHFSEERLRRLIDAAPVAMLVVGSDGRIALANRQAEQTFGYSGSELLGADVEILVPDAYRGGHRKHLDQFFCAPTPRVMGVGREVVGRHATGREFPVEIGLTPMEHGGESYVVAAVIDVTERREIERESTLARIVQQSTLPRHVPECAGCDVAGASQAAFATGGDFFDYLQLSAGRLGVVIGDASGHGFAAALVSASARSYIRALSQVMPDLSDVLATTNRLLIEEVPDGRFVTLFYASIDPTNHALSYAGAGHIGYLIRSTGELKQLLESTGPPLGWFPGAEYPPIRVTIERGDLLVLLTDGIEEAMCPTGEPFGRARVIDVIRRNSGQSATHIVQAILAAATAFRGTADQHDDVTTVVVKIV